MNRLSREHSPYLLQHAENPVDWYPWGDAAFSRARAEDKPIFLSIGYSTCHWCHVMEHESFENASVAAMLNEHFVSIKVDREERPDVDRVYMTFVQATTGSGGWPMSVWLTPDLKPFYGGTYFPPTSRWGRAGFVDVLGEIARAWKDNSAEIVSSARQLTERLQTAQRETISSVVPSTMALERAVADLGASFDHRYGGFGSAPKFPRPAELLLLLREHARTGDVPARDMALATLDAMALGGMRDHIGGGFHRYSVDAAWRVPHFEKMLYDQAQLALAYLEASQVSGNRFYREVAEDTLQYVIREMTHPDGGFYSAEDADSVPPEMAGEPDAHKTEGAFYLWTDREIDTLLADDAALVKGRFGIERDGNAPADPQQEFTGKNLLYVARSIAELAADSGKPPGEVEGALHRAQLVMFEARLVRPHPQLDDKVLTAWNGLMIAAFARAARLVGSARYLDVARRAASFIENRLWDENAGVLLRRFRDGHAEIEAYAEDYAFLVYGLLELFQADPDPRWLSWAVRLQRQQDDLFWDETHGGWFSTTGHDPTVLLRMKEDHDGAEPSASSVSVMNLIVMSHLIEEPQWPARIEKTLRLFGERLERASRAVPMMAAALSTHAAGLQQIVLIEGEGAAALVTAIGRRYLPFAIALQLTPDRQKALAEMLPFISAMGAVQGDAAVYVCRNFTCRQPVTTVVDLDAELDDILSVRGGKR